MPFTTWASADLLTAAKLNNDNSVAVGTDTARTITVTHSWTASQTFTGGFTTGASATLGGNLLFTDATYDIGASGATRPRDFYLSRNAVVGGTASVTGTLSPLGLLDASGASAGQVKFPATQNASSDANTLDDYEESNWTISDQSGASLTFTTGTDATAIKIGRLVIAQFTITYPVTANGSNATIGTLPYTTGTQTNANWAGVVAFTDQGNALTLLAGSAGTTFTIRNAATGANMTNANMSAKSIRGCVIYVASA